MTDPYGHITNIQFKIDLKLGMAKNNPQIYAQKHLFSFYLLADDPDHTKVSFGNLQINSASPHTQRVFSHAVMDITCGQALDEFGNTPEKISETASAFSTIDDLVAYFGKDALKPDFRPAA